HVPGRLGGQGQGLLALAVVTEALAQACSSSAMCYGMHCVGTAVIAAKATRDQEERYLRPIAQGRHVTTLALTETGTGSRFHLPPGGRGLRGGREQELHHQRRPRRLLRRLDRVRSARR